jgi:hypothetical protein
MRVFAWIKRVVPANVVLLALSATLAVVRVTQL